MGFLKDFIGQAATQLKQASPVQAGAARVAGRGPARRAGEGGLDFMSALHAHRHWKIRLADYVRSGSRDRMDYRAVGRDDRSELGQWIHGDARRRWGHLPSFGLLRSTHALFHLAAGHIVLLHHQGRTAEALRLMRGGEYPRQSLKVMGLLGALYDESVRLPERAASPGAAKRPPLRGSLAA